jgi:polyhydroxybutyrate depolymerase
MGLAAAVLLLPGSSDATEAPVSALGVTAPDTPPDLAGTTVAGHTVLVGGTARTFRTIFPERPAAMRLPLLIVLAGRGEGGWTAVRTTGFLPLARSGRAALAYPDGIGRSWDAGGGCCGVAGRQGTPDTALVAAVAAGAERALPIDPARVYLAGYSNGGKLAYAAACADPDRYAGVATYGAVPLTACTGRTRPLPFLLAAGVRDPILPFGGAPHAHPPTLGVPAAAAGLVAHDRCVTTPQRSSSGPATLTRWTGCAGGTSVELAVYPAADHGWPPSVAGLMWTFLTGAPVTACAAAFTTSISPTSSR